MTKRLKILQLQPKCDVRAADLQEEIANAFSKKEFEVTNAYFHGNPNKTGIHSNSEKTHYFNFSNRKRKGLRLWLIYKVWRFCRKNNFDVVITHRFKPLDVMLKLNHFLKIPQCVAVIHGFGDFDRHYRKKNLRKYNTKQWRYVAISPPVYTYLKKLDNGLIKHQLVLINNAINIQKITSIMLSKHDAREELGLPQDVFLFGTIGRLVKIKGHIHLLEAFKKLHYQQPNAHLVIIGEGKERNHLENYITQNQLSKVVFLPGEIINANRFVKAFDCFVLPSLEEGFGMVLLEAMAGKTPCIASNVGGIPTVLGDRGKLVPPADVDALANAMKTQLNLSNSEMQALGLMLYKRLQDNFGIQAYHQQFKKLIPLNSVQK